jgi:hypothetical protein
MTLEELKDAADKSGVAYYAAASAEYKAEHAAQGVAYYAAAYAADIARVAYASAYYAYADAEDAQDDT